MARFINEKTRASDPGKLTLSENKLRILRPDLCGVRGILTKLKIRLGREWDQRLYIEEHIEHGDSRAAVVVSLDPLLVAAYTDELDCVAMLWFFPALADIYELEEGSRLLTINTYTSPGDGRDYQTDLILGPNMNKRWIGFSPIIAEFVSDDTERIQTRKGQIVEDEWERALTLGKEYMKTHPKLYRDGRPVYASVSAHDL